MGFVCLFIINGNLKAAENISSNNTSHSTKSLLWISPHTEPENDLIFKGFNHLVNKNVNITYLSIEESIGAIQEVDSNQYLFIVASGDKAWNLIDPLETMSTKIGVGVSDDIFNSQISDFNTNEYLISKEQPLRRLFAFISALDLNHSQSTALFYKHELIQKQRFIRQAKSQDIPFKPVAYSKMSTVVDIMNSIHNCCKIFYLKQNSFENKPEKLRATLMESYRRKIITIGNRKQMLTSGAMFTIYTPEHLLGKQTSSLVNDLLDGRSAKAYQRPEQFVIESNLKMKKAMGGKLAKKSIGSILTDTKIAENVSDREIFQ